MNAVNLIPSDGRRQRLSVSTSPQTLGVLGGLVLVLVAAVLYISTANTVSSRKSQLAQVTAGVTQWTAAVNSYSSFVATASQRLQDLVVVRQLAASRFPWQQLLGQIATVMPKTAALSSLSATTASASGTTGAAPAPSATTASGAAAAGIPAVSLSGCAASESIVAQTMVQLHRVKGVSDVTLTSATDSSTGSSGSSSSGAAGASGGCPFSVQFQLSLTFSSPTPPAATTSTPSATTSTPAATASAPSASAPSTTSAAQ
jgi:Tfp pilus assembly protein PilN